MSTLSLPTLSSLDPTAPEQISLANLFVPIDFSDVSQWAIEYAKGIAKRFDSKIILAHVNEPINPITPPEVVWFDELTTQLPAEEFVQGKGNELRSQGYRVETNSLVGSIQQEILAAADRERADLIVIGTHGRVGIQRLLFGSDAEAIYRTATIPILAIGPHAPATPGLAWEPKQLVFACDLNPDSAPMAAYAYHLAYRLGANLTIFQVENPAREIGDDRRLNEFIQALTPLLPTHLEPNVIRRALLLGYLLGSTIVDFAREHHADLIVIGARPASSSASHLPLGVAPQVIAEALCPVMVIHRQ